MAAAAFTILPRFVLGGKGFAAPSDTLYIAGIGVGGKSTNDLNGFAGSPDGKTKDSPNAKIAFLCDVDDNMAKDSVRNFPSAMYYKDLNSHGSGDHRWHAGGHRLLFDVGRKREAANCVAICQLWVRCRLHDHIG